MTQHHMNLIFSLRRTHKNKNEERHAEDNHKRKLIDAGRSQHYAGRFRMLLDCTLFDIISFFVQTAGSLEP